MKNKKRLLNSLVGVLLGVFLLGGLAVAINSSTTGYKISNIELMNIDLYSNDYEIKNLCERAAFISTKTEDEYQSFIDNHPDCLKVNPFCSNTEHINPQTLAGNTILYENATGTYEYAAGYCRLVMGCAGYERATVVENDQNSCRCSNYWGCNAESCTTSSTTWKRYGSITCTNDACDTTADCATGYTCYLGACAATTVSCVLDGVTVLDGASATFYSTESVTGDCSSYDLVRTCTNGILSGSSAYAYATCETALCSTSEFTCESGACINADFVCDGDADCYWQEGYETYEHDEQGCDASCPDGFFCWESGSGCIDSYQLCDGNDDCANGEDETGCY